LIGSTTPSKLGTIARDLECLLQEAFFIGVVESHPSGKTNSVHWSKLKRIILYLYYCRYSLLILLVIGIPRGDSRGRFDVLETYSSEAVGDD